MFSPKVVASVDHDALSDNDINQVETLTKNQSNDDEDGDDDDDQEEGDNDSEGAVADACYLYDQDLALDDSQTTAGAITAQDYPGPATSSAVPVLPQFAPLLDTKVERHEGLLPLGGHARVATTQLDGYIRTKRPRVGDLIRNTTAVLDSSNMIGASTSLVGVGTEVASMENVSNNSTIEVQQPLLQQQHHKEVVMSTSEAEEASVTAEADLSTSSRNNNGNNNNNNNNMSSFDTGSSSSTVGAVDGGSSSLTVTSNSTTTNGNNPDEGQDSNNCSSSSSSSHSSNSSIAGSQHAASGGGGGSDGLAQWQWRSHHSGTHRRPTKKLGNNKINHEANNGAAGRSWSPQQKILLQQPSSGSFSSALTAATLDDEVLDDNSSCLAEEEVGAGSRTVLYTIPQRDDQQHQELPLHSYGDDSTTDSGNNPQPHLEQDMMLPPEEESVTALASTARAPTVSSASKNISPPQGIELSTTFLELPTTPQHSMLQPAEHSSSFYYNYEHPPTPKASNVATFRSNHSTFNFNGDTAASARQQEYDSRDEQLPPNTITMDATTDETTRSLSSSAKNHRKHNKNHRRHRHHHGKNHHGDNSHSDAVAVDQLTTRLSSWCSINIKTKRRNNIYTGADEQQQQQQQQQLNDNQYIHESSTEQQQQQLLPSPPLVASYPAVYRSNLYNPTQDYDYSNHRLSRHIRKLHCQSANKEVMRTLRNGNKQALGGVGGNSNDLVDSIAASPPPPSFLWIVKDTDNAHAVTTDAAGNATDPATAAEADTNIASHFNECNTDVIMGD